MIVKDRYAEAEFKDVIRYKVKWIFKIIYNSIYKRYSDSAFLIFF